VQTEIGRSERYVGLFIVAALVAAIGYAVFAEAERLRDVRRYLIKARQTYGLEPGNAVKLADFRIGEVESVELQPDNRVWITFRVDAPYYERIDVTARAHVVAPLASVIPGQINIVPGGEGMTEELGDGATISHVPPRVSTTTILDDVGETVGQMRDLAYRVNERDETGAIKHGLMELIGIDRADALSDLLASAQRLVDDELAVMAADMRSMLDEVSSGRRTLAQIALGDATLQEVVAGPDRTLLQALVGDAAQDRLDRIASGRQTAVEFLLGAERSATVDALLAEAVDAGKTGNTLLTQLTTTTEQVNGLLAGSDDLLAEVQWILDNEVKPAAGQLRGLLTRVDGLLADASPLVSEIGARSDDIGEMVAVVLAILRDVEVISGEIAGASDEIPRLIRSGQSLMADTDELIDSLQRNWLISGFMSSPPPTRVHGATPADRPNPYTDRR
jgi:ABC-type transporter Mla subunit MlaD